MQAKSEFFCQDPILWGLERKFVASYKKNPLVASKDLKFCRFKPENRKNKKKLLQARSKIEDRRYNKIKKLHGRGKKKEKERERERENIKQDPNFLETNNKVCCKATTTSRVCRDTNISRQTKPKQTQQLSVKSSLVKCESDEREGERERLCVCGAGGH
jgi:hypothetical protein